MISIVINSKKYEKAKGQKFGNEIEKLREKCRDKSEEDPETSYEEARSFLPLYFEKIEKEFF